MAAARPTTQYTRAGTRLGASLHMYHFRHARESRADDLPRWWRIQQC